MPLPIVTIVGRPNVGKSSLLNTLAGRRISIVEPTAGVTRDRIATVVEQEGRFFELVDTGGYGIVDRDDLSDQVEQQIRSAVDSAAAILFMVDAQQGVLPLDQKVADWLRGTSCPVLLVANKVDAADTVVELGDFHRLGFGEPVPVSSLHRRGFGGVRSWIAEHLPPAEEDMQAEPTMKLALVGRRNAGKSTMINSLAGQERVIVSEVAGTTRDAVDVRFEYQGRTFLAIDTAGLRKKRKVADDIEYYSFHRAELSVRRADVVLLLLDATAEVGQVDKQLGRYIADQHKPCVIVINKWDLAKDRATTEAYGEYLAKTMPALQYAPVAFVTAKDGKNLQSLIDLSIELFKQSRTRIGTGELNQVLREVIDERTPRPKRGSGAVKVYFGTQVAVAPPTLVLFVNDPARVSPGFEKFITGRLRDALPFAEVPMRLVFRSRRGRSVPGEAQAGRDEE